MSPLSQWSGAEPIMVVGRVAGEVQVVRPMASPNRAARLPHPWGQVQSQLQPRHITVSLEPVGPGV